MSAVLNTPEGPTGWSRRNGGYVLPNRGSGPCCPGTPAALVGHPRGRRLSGLGLARSAVTGGMSPTSALVASARSASLAHWPVAQSRRVRKARRAAQRIGTVPANPPAVMWDRPELIIPIP